MTDTERRLAAQQFVKDWTGHGDEKQETQRFWMGLLQKVYGVAEPDKFIEFEKRVVLGHTSFIDGYIRDTRVLIEQKGADIDLRKGYRQSDGSMLTPYQQARRYAGNLPHDMNPRWIVVCNFKEFHIHDMNRPNDPAEVVLLEDLPKEYHRLQFLVDTGSEHIRKEMRISLQAGELVGKLYDALLKQYNSPASEEELKSLNMLCVRLVFCLYAEDAGVFGGHDKFRNYLKSFQPKNVRSGLIKLFEVLDTKEADRDPYMDDDLAAFPYVNGGLFADKNIIVPKFTDEIITLLVEDCGGDFNWSEISPTIFGAVFESTLNPETRRAGGMHYTSIENIHKVIDPLFYNQLCQELEEIAAIGVEKTRKLRLEQYQAALAKLKFLDPACGSGNFLTETYISLRRLENRVIAMLGSIGKGAMEGQIVMGEGDINPIKVSIGQFYGIEINDFAVTVAKTALWIAESQMMKATEELVHMNLDFLPLKSYAHIVEGNALRIDWETVIPKTELSYIMGNPPFVGLSLRTPPQQADMDLVFANNPRAGRLDYVAAWYIKAAEMIGTSDIQAAFVSTNSIVQGEQVPILWEDMFKHHNMTINFAHRPFAWNSEAKDKATVHCVIIGFGFVPAKQKVLFESDIAKPVERINGYLVNAENVFIQLRGKPQKGYPQLIQGNKPWDGGNLILSEDEAAELIKSYPQAASFVKLFIGSQEFINGKKRYCLWLKGVSPKEYYNIPEIKRRLEGVAEVRRKTKTVAVQAQAETPMLFSQIRQPASEYILIPETSSEKRKYIPIGFMPQDVIASNSTLVATNATLYHFGVLTSNVHMAWMRTVCGRLEMRYRYSPSVYNNFPWPTPTEAQKAKIEQTAQAILDAREMYSDCSLAILYDESTMPAELRTAHQRNDRAVWEAYGKCWDITSETACVGELMKMYQALTT